MKSENMFHVEKFGALKNQKVFLKKGRKFSMG